MTDSVLKILIKSEKKSFNFLCDFNNYNFEDINEISKYLIKIYKFLKSAYYFNFFVAKTLFINFKI